VVVAVGDRPYYRGPGYWSGRAYYVWKPGHWSRRHGQQVWIRGHYVLRGY
jgi:WXXGXW repeat (2 copies)